MWKMKSILAAFVTGLVFLLVFPLITIFINNAFHLPIFSSILYQVFGLVLCLSGALIFLYCSSLFSKLGKGTPAPIDPPNKLVVKGLYQHTRNPIYVGYFLLLLGEFFVLGFSLLLIYSIVIAFSIHLYVVYVEEPVLKKRFGDSYIGYTQQVPRWFFKI